MKKIYLIFSLFFISHVSFADNETVQAQAGGPVASTPADLGYVTPCSQVIFIVSSTITPGFDRLEKYEWIVNGQLVKTSTTTADQILPLDIKSKTYNVYCRVTYKNFSTGALSSPKSSNTFTPFVKDLNFDPTIFTSTPSPNYGCTTSTVSYSLSQYTCTNYCNTTYNWTGSYSITWQPPAGWVQTSISTNGNNVSFTPDALTSGALVATIHLPCGYTETRTFNISRLAPSPTFTTPIVQTCTSSATMSINPICGASDYTYKIVGNPGVTFTSNGQQTLTSASTSLNFSISGGTSINSISAKANYPNNSSSSETSSTLTVGVTQPGPISFLYIDGVMGKIHAVVEEVPGTTSYNWYKNGVLVVIPPVHGHGIQIPISRTQCDVEYDISVEAVNSCGTSARTHANAYVPCDNFVISPNPAISSFSVEAVNTNAKIGETSIKQTNAINVILVTDKMGNMIKQYTYSSLTKVSINISDLKADTYFVKIYNGKVWVSKQLLIVR